MPDQATRSTGRTRRTVLFVIAAVLAVLLIVVGASWVGLRHGSGIAAEATHRHVQGAVDSARAWSQAVQVLARGKLAVGRAFGRVGPRAGEGQLLMAEAQAVPETADSAQLREGLEAFVRTCVGLLDHAAISVELLHRLDEHHRQAMVRLATMDEVLTKVERDEGGENLTAVLAVSRCRSVLQHLRIGYVDFACVRSPEELAQAATSVLVPEYFTQLRDRLQRLADREPRVSEPARTLIDESFGYEDTTAELYLLLSEQVRGLLGELAEQESAIIAAAEEHARRLDTAAEQAAGEVIRNSW